MKILKYEGSNMRQALSQIKEELGDNAMVVSTRDIRRGLLGRGVEISVAIDVDEQENSPRPSSTNRKMETGRGAGYGLQDTDVERIMAPLRSELRSLRSMMRANSESRTSEELRQELSAMRLALQDLQQSVPKVQSDNVSQAGKSLNATMGSFPITAPSSGRIVALVGPTGVGKTTTIAKLAANAVFREQKQTAIVTLDTYRVGGEEQIRTYADLIGAPLFVIRDASNLAAQLSQLGMYDKIFIDTAGRSPRDVPAIRALRTNFTGVKDLEVHLTLALTTPQNVIDANHLRFSEIGIDRLLFTKLDESIEFEQLVRSPARLQVPISYITTGQAVPEDLENASEESLLAYAQQGYRIFPGDDSEFLAGAA